MAAIKDGLRVELTLFQGNYYYINGYGEWALFPVDNSGKKTYKILLTQIGSAVPEVTVLQNTLEGAAPVFSRSSQGSFAITKSGGFPLGRTAITPGSVIDEGDSSNPGAMNIIPNDNGNSILIYTFSSSNALADTCFYRTLITVDVYPPAAE
mgnify:CR=1 FL=1